MHLSMKTLSFVLALPFAACPENDDDGPSTSVRDQRIRAAAVIGSCLPDDGVQRNLASLLYDARPYDGLVDIDAALACLAKSTDGCAALERCTGVTFSIDEQCQSGCDGQRLTSCDDAAKFELDCPSGTTCNAEEGACSPNTGAECDFDTFEDRCDGTRPIGCNGGREAAYGDCADAGLVCVDDGSVYCAGTGAACSADTLSPYIEGFIGTCSDAATLSACVGNKLHSVTCADIDPEYACHTSGGVSFCGLAAECNPLDSESEPTCDDSKILVCDAGQRTPVDCATLGFTGCVEASDGGTCTPSPTDSDL